MKNALALIMIAVVLAGCAKPAQSQDTSAAAFTDALGREVSVAKIDTAAAASGSFAQVWLLAGGNLAGATDDAFKNFDGIPPEAVNLGGVMNPSLEAILALNPDLLILSADVAGQVSLEAPLAAAHITAAYFSVESFGDYLNMLKICTGLTGREDLYEQNGARLQSEIDGVIEDARMRPAPKVLLLRASSGKVTVRDSGTMAGAMLADLGCVNIADSEAALLDNLSMEIIIQEDPDFIFAVTQGDSEEQAREALNAALTSNPAWSGLKAVREGRYISLPKDLFHLKPNARWAEAYQKLFDILFSENLK